MKDFREISTPTADLTRIWKNVYMIKKYSICFRIVCHGPYEENYSEPVRRESTKAVQFSQEKFTTPKINY